MPGEAFRTHRPPWAAPDPRPYLWIPAVLGAGIVDALLLGLSAIDPVGIYAHLPAAVRVLQTSMLVATLTGGLLGALLGGLVWAMVTLVSWRSDRLRRD